jgi:hypothetical protein
VYEGQQINMELVGSGASGLVFSREITPEIMSTGVGSAFRMVGSYPSPALSNSIHIGFLFLDER